jgi:hypothetical protein
VAELLRHPRSKTSSHFSNMKTPINARSVPNAGSPSRWQISKMRAPAAQPVEQRHERRKIREPLRGLDWEFDRENKIIA